jgi:hypothetical protein
MKTLMPITIVQRDDFEAAFGALGAKVGPRLGIKKRDHDEKEWYVVRRFMKEAIAQKMFLPPLTIEKGHPPEPDFIVQHKSKVLIEITEATNGADQREMTLLELSDKPILLGELGGRFEGGGGEPGHVWSSDIVEAIERKETKTIFSSTSAERHLVIFPNSNASTLIFNDKDELRAFSILRKAIDERRSKLTRITNGCFVHVLGKDYVFFDVLGRGTRRRRK